MKEETADVGVLVGRFQVHNLHEGHKKLFEEVMNKHTKVLVFLGMGQAKSTVRNPLDYQTREQMLKKDYPNLIIGYIKDVHDDALWSKTLDEKISDLVHPGQSVTLYGSRDSFIPHYKGKYTTEELDQEIYTSGTYVRKKVINDVKNSPDFRAGAIWAVNNQFPTVHPTVDVAIFNNKFDKLLLARKPSESKFRFVGGFVNPGETLEQAARRETREETHLDVEGFTYVKSFAVDDWRYRAERNKITTSLFQGIHQYGAPRPDDDIEELKWFDWEKCLTKNFSRDNIVPVHQQLLTELIRFRKDR